MTISLATDPTSVRVAKEFYDNIFDSKVDISVADVDSLDPDKRD